MGFGQFGGWYNCIIYIRRADFVQQNKAGRQRLWDTTCKFRKPFAIRIAGNRALYTDAKRPRSGVHVQKLCFLISHPPRTQVRDFIAQDALLRKPSCNEKLRGVLQCSKILFHVPGKPGSNALLAFFGQQIIGG